MTKLIRSAVVSLLAGLTFKTPETWDDAKIQKKLAILPEKVDEDAVTEYKLTDEQAATLKVVLAGGEFELVGDDAVAATPAKKKAAAPAAKPAAKPAAAAPAKKAAAAPKEPKPKKPGVVQTMLDLYLAATKEKPITKAKILAVLTKKFGPGTEQNRPVAGMKSTVAASSSSMRTEKGYNVCTDGQGGFWFQGRVKGK